MAKRMINFMLMISFISILCSCNNSASTDNSSDNQGDTSILESGAIDLNDLSQSIDIPLGQKIIKLTRGNYVYTYTKKANLNNEKYIVDTSNMISYTSAHQASPDDAYSQVMEIVSIKDKRAVRAINSFKSGTMKIETKQDMEQAKQLIADANYLNSAKLLVAIFPANNSIKMISREIKGSDVITVSGARYKITAITHNNQKEPITHCLAMDLFYLTDLEIE
ncbi:MAG: hypothetical protein KJ915_02275 [Candidatus Omnitrophica bacterium]|nr:hypothetical protein [Candidatus Omnitrophota bacterium]